jgi:hypothetical protein
MTPLRLPPLRSRPHDRPREQTNLRTSDRVQRDPSGDPMLTPARRDAFVAALKWAVAKRDGGDGVDEQQLSATAQAILKAGRRRRAEI